MYKYKKEGNLIDGIFSMITLFQKNNIKPIFIFDGKPPIEKQELIEKRNQNKKTTEIKYNKLTLEFNKLTQDKNNNNHNNNNNIMLIDKLEKEIVICKRNMVSLSYKDICDVKMLISYMGEDYYESYTEADGVIAKLIDENKVWGCMSEDMDMFIYGCPYVLRYFSIVNEEVIMYDFKKILKTLNLNLNDFKEICILSGTDYNTTIDYNITLVFNKYIEYSNSEYYNNISFYSWLNIKNDYIDINKLNTVTLLFDLKYINLNKVILVKGNTNFTKMRELLTENGYIFI
jgi:5'-3' exonuclease